MKNIIISVVLGFILFPSTAQKEIKKPNYSHALSVTISDLFVGRIKANYEFMGLKNTNYSPGIGLSYASRYKKNYGTEEYNYSRITFGVELSNKIYANNFYSLKGHSKTFYINPALKYNHHTFSYLGNSWVEFQEEGTNSTLYQLDESTELEAIVHSVSFSPHVGVVFTRSNFFMDLYGGINIIKDFEEINIGNDDLPLTGWGQIGLKHFNTFIGFKTGVCF